MSSDPERQTQYVVTRNCLLYVKKGITRLQPTTPEKLGNKDPNRDMHRCTCKREIVRAPEQIESGETRQKEGVKGMGRRT